MGNHSYHFHQIPANYKQGNVLLRLRVESQSLYLNFFEGLFYCYLLYSIFAVRLGIDIPYTGSAWLFTLAGMTLFFRDRPPWRKLHLTLIFLMAGSFLAIQFLLFEAELNFIKGFINVLPLALIIDKLVARRNFICRLAIVMLIISVLLIPSIISERDKLVSAGEMRLYSESGPITIYRATTEGTGIDNPNDLACWFGFWTLVFWLWGLKQPKLHHRMFTWSCALVGLSLISWTVSRGALLALLAGIILGFRRLKLWQRLGILAFLTALFLAWYGSFLFTGAVEGYKVRFFQETGRFFIWPYAIEKIINYPWIGSGIKNALIFVPSIFMYKTPHNAILFLWVTSGIIPVIFFIYLNVKALVEARRWTSGRNEQSIDPLPLVAYAIISFQFSNLYFLTTWAITALCYSFGRFSPFNRVKLFFLHRNIHIIQER